MDAIGVLAADEQTVLGFYALPTVSHKLDTTDILHHIIGQGELLHDQPCAASAALQVAVQYPPLGFDSSAEVPDLQ